MYLKYAILYIDKKDMGFSGYPLKPEEREDNMSKNITAKQFKEIMTKAGYDFDVWGWGGYLNTISSLLSDASTLNEIESKFDSAKCITEVARINKEQAHIIYDELDKVGYYNDYK